MVRVVLELTMTVLSLFLVRERAPSRSRHSRIRGETSVVHSGALSMSQAKVQQLYKLDRLLQEESGTLHSLQQDKVRISIFPRRCSERRVTCEENERQFSPKEARFAKEIPRASILPPSLLLLPKSNDEND